MTVLRWGIASAGKISNDFTVGLSCLPQDEHTVAAVGARNKKRAEEFAKLHGIPSAYGSYEELAKDPKVDVVYIGSVNPEHLWLAKLMLENGKHVLCEKPLCMNVKQSTELIAVAQSKNLFLMEAIWSRFFPSYQYLKKQIENGALGEIQSVEASFGFDLRDVDRLQMKNLGGGTVLDLGVYTIQVSQWAFREVPHKIVATGELNSDGVDIAMEAELHYSGGRTAKIKTSAKGLLDNKATIKGTKGQITLNTFWCSDNLVDVDGSIKRWDLPKTDKFLNFPNSQGLCYEAECVRKCILEKRTQCETVSWEDSLTIANIQDTIRKQIGLVFPQD